MFCSNCRKQYVKNTINVNVHYSLSLDWRTRGNLLPGILYVSFDFYSNQVSDLSIAALAFPVFHAQAAN
jgi:hypothetical protein